MRFIAAALFSLAVAACATASPQAETQLDALAETYVRLSLEIGTHEDGYIDAYYGPPEWKTEAEAAPRSIDELQAATTVLQGEVDRIAASGIDDLEMRRARTLSAYIAAARFRMEMMEGVRVPFVEEAERLFALRPDILPLHYYDEALQRMNSLVPGDGPLADRVNGFMSRFVVPQDRADAVMRAAIAECRRRTAEYLDLPANERFDFEFVTDRPWGAYNWYQGDNHSLIQVNASNPLMISSAVNYGCHEGYPGHHVQGIYAERMYRERGWVEYSILPLYSPMGPLNEGAGNYGVLLAFPGDDRVAFEMDVLFPLAGLDAREAPLYYELTYAMQATVGAARTIQAQYLDGDITRERAIELLQHYRLASRASAEQSLRFADTYRSYIINYSSGQELVREFAETGRHTQAERWDAYRRILTEPTLPRDLAQ
jgi:hypothetical protein